MLSPLSSFTVAVNNAVATTPAVGSSRASDSDGSDNVVHRRAAATAIVSSLARQLSEAAARAELRDNTLDKEELTQKAKELVSKLLSDSRKVDEALNDAQVPDSDDAERLARARQATDFLSGNASNPFKDLSREQLALITYDESDAFTIDERRAAWEAASAQEQAWRQMISRQGTDEYNATGKITETLKQTLEHYRALPAIERAQYPANYQGEMLSKIIMSTYDAPEWPKGVLLSLWDTVEELFDEGRFASPASSSETQTTEPSNTDSLLPSAT
ncbi:hypothetical protein PS3A_19410 [Pseudomonas sp. 3A(2025)]